MTMKHPDPRMSKDVGLDEATVQEFEASLRGELVQPGDEGYEEARKVYNGMIDRRPRLIAYCANVADVIAAVNFSRENDMVVAIRGGGHVRTRGPFGPFPVLRNWHLWPKRSGGSPC